jgi:oligopeptide transport system substrate-binding protein
MRLGFEGAPITEEGLVIYDPQWTKPVAGANGYPGLITNGAYRLADWKFKRRARLIANPFVRDDMAPACRIVDMAVIPSIDAAILAYEGGSVDFLPAMDVPYDHEIARLSRSGERPDFRQCPALATYFFNFNCSSPVVNERKNPFVDPRVRLAFSLAADKRAIVEQVLRRGDRVAGSLVPADAAAGYAPPAGLRFDPHGARTLLAECGHAGGDGLPPIEILYTSADERVCQALARMWQDELGVTIELRSKESKAFAEDKQALRYMISRGNWYGDYADPTTFLDILTTGNGNNDCGYTDLGYDALIRGARGETNAEKRSAMLRDAEAMIVERDCPILPLLHPSVPVAIKPHVRGLYPNSRLWFPFWNITVSR